MPPSPDTSTGAPPASGRKRRFSLAIPVTLLLAVAVAAFAIYRYQLLPHIRILPDIPALTTFPDADPALFPVASEPPHPAPAPPGFGSVQWQITPAEMRAIEAVPPFRTSPTAIVYSLEILNQPCMLTYFFQRNQLYGAQFQFSAPGSAFLPALTVQQARKLHDQLKARLDARYGPTEAAATSVPRPETADLASRLRIARRQLDALPADTPGNTAAEARNLVADLEGQLRAAEAADRDNPILARLLSKWTSGPMSVTLVADFTTTPPGIEIRYRATLSRHPPQPH